MERVTIVIDGVFGVFAVNTTADLESLAEVSELINELVKAKNTAFPSGAAQHRRKMEALAVPECKDAR